MYRNQLLEDPIERFIAGRVGEDLIVLFAGLKDSLLKTVRCMRAVSAANHRIPFGFQRTGMASQESEGYMNYDVPSGPHAIIWILNVPKASCIKNFSAWWCYWEGEIFKK